MDSPAPGTPTAKSTPPAKIQRISSLKDVKQHSATSRNPYAKGKQVPRQASPEAASPVASEAASPKSGSEKEEVKPVTEVPPDQVVAAEKDDDDDDDDDQVQTRDVDLVREMVERHKEEQALAFSSLTPEQLARLAVIRPLKIPDRHMQRMMTPHIGPNSKVSKTMTIVIHGATKVYLGELVRTAKQVQEDWKEDVSKPLRPDHLREAHRRLQLETGDTMPRIHPPRSMFK